jgi:hypothetical protein
VARWSSITPAVRCRGEEARRWRIHGLAPTWERRGRQQLGGQEVASRGGAMPIGGGGKWRCASSMPMVRGDHVGRVDTIPLWS